jgi:hypothetical protein
MPSFTAYYCTPTGKKQKRLWFKELNFSHSLGCIGEGKIVVPSGKDTFAPYSRVNIYRQEETLTNNGVFVLTDVKESLVFSFFILKIQFQTTDEGEYLTSLSGLSVDQFILSSRVTAYREQTANTKKSADYADDVIKDLVRENLTTSSGTDYDGNTITKRTISSYLLVDTDSSSGGLVSWEGAFKNLLEELQSIQRATIASGGEVFFGITYQTDELLLFSTKLERWGRYKPGFIFGQEMGNIRGASLTADHTREVNAVYGLWSGTGAQRNIIEADIDDSMNYNPFSRREIAVNVSRAETEEAAELAVYNELKKRRATLKFTGQIMSTFRTPYGASGWMLGDVVTANYVFGFETSEIFGIPVNQKRYVADVMIRRVNVRVDSNGMENITGDIESVAVRQVGV